MTTSALEPRVATLEDAMRELAFQSTLTQRELARLSREMAEFKDEMAEFKDEMKEFKDEMREFKDEMKTFKDEVRRDQRESNRKWGDMANRLGTIVEDLVAPSLPRIIQETIGEEVIDLSVRRKRRLPGGRSQEFDAIAVTPSLVCLNSTKATLRSADVYKLIDEIDQLREFFPEYRKVPVVGILATLDAEDSVVRHASRLGFLVLAVGDALMEVQNPPGFEPKRW